MRRNPRILAGALLLVVALLAADGTAGAASLDRSGWWWRAQSGLGAPLPAPPHVPEDGLLVAGEPGGPTAVAAVRFVLEDDERDPELTLAVADDRGGEAAVLLACATGSGWRPAQAGRWTDRPEADCEGTAVEGVRAEDGLSWTFDLAPLLVDRVVEAVLVPGSVPEAPEGVDGSTFSLAFEPPTDASLATTREQPTSDDFDLAPFPGGFDGGGSSGSGSGFGGGTSFEPPASSPSFTPPASPSFEPPASTGSPSDDLVAATGSDGTGAGAGAPPPVAAQPAVDDDQDRILAGVVLALAAAAVLWAAQQPTPALRRLGALAGGDDAHAPAPQVAAEQAAPRMGGIGRFARPRTGPVPRL